MTEDEIVKAMDEAYLNTTPHGDAMHAAYHVARAQALREAAAVCEDYERDGQNTKAYACETADELAARILALISQEPANREKPFTCTYPNCKCPVSFPESHKPSTATECPRSPEP